MSIEQIKKTIHLRIEHADERLLRVIHAMTEAYITPSEEEIMSILPPAKKSLTKKELIAEIEEANAEIERGEFITSEELEKEMKKW